MHVGVYSDTSPLLIDRVVFSNLVYLVGILLTLSLAPINLAKSYYPLLAINGLFLLALGFGFYFNLCRQYLFGRVLTLALVFLGMFLAGVLQGPVVEIEHFFLPLGILAFSVFRPGEKKYSFGFLFVSVAAYFLLVSQHGPLWPVDPAAGRYSSEDRFANRIGYLTLYAACLMALSKAFERATKIIDEQRDRLYEERRLAAFGSVVGNVAHEINSPLAALDLQLFHLDSLLKRGLSAEEVRERIEKIRKVSQRLSSTVRGLKFISGQDQGDSLVRSPIGTLVESARDLTRDRMEKEGVEFRIKLSYPEQAVACRPVALSQVFLNLLSHALDAVENLPEDRKWIELKDDRHSGRLFVTVTDGGLASPGEAGASLSRNFYTTPLSSGRSSGLGLSISRETVEAHGGTLRFDPVSPHTRFIVELPLPAEDQ